MEALFRAGTVRPDTLVWREGMAEWLPYAQAKGPPAGSPLRMAGPVSAPPGQVLCAECGQAFPPEEVIRHGNQFICAACEPVFLQKLKEGVMPQAALNYAGFWIRFVAYIVDSIALPVVLLPEFLFIRPGGGGRVNPLDMNLDDVFINFLICLGLTAAYFTFFVGKYGATPGKMATKLRIVNPDGSPVSYAKACGRMFAVMVSCLCHIGVLIGVLMAAWDPEKRGLHDRICNTRVIRT